MLRFALAIGLSVAIQHVCHAEYREQIGRWLVDRNAAPFEEKRTIVATMSAIGQTMRRPLLLLVCGQEIEIGALLTLDGTMTVAFGVPYSLKARFDRGSVYTLEAFPSSRTALRFQPNAAFAEGLRVATTLHLQVVENTAPQHIISFDIKGSGPVMDMLESYCPKPPK